jgi:RHS repeat-associated protein
MEASGYAYSVTEVEKSPLLRTLEQGAPGKAWQPYNSGIPGSGHTLKTEYGVNTNTGADYVKKWYIDTNGKPKTTQHFLAGALYKVKTTDEDGNISYVYKNNENKEILKKSPIGAEEALTYYVYDDFGNLRFVIPPEAVKNYPNIDPWITEYKYDGYNRQIEKQMPERAVVTTIYDPLGRVVLGQDGLMRANNDWLFTKYDVQGRVVFSGIYHHSSNMNREAMQNWVDARIGHIYAFHEKHTATTNYGYTNNAFPDIDDCIIWTINYYDDYDFDNDGNDDAALISSPYPANGMAETIDGYSYYIDGHKMFDRVKGKITKTMVKILKSGEDGIFIGDAALNECPTSPNELYYKGAITLRPGFSSHMGQKLHIGPNISLPSATSENWLQTVNIYDSKGRVIQTQSKNHLDPNALDITNTQYDFSGKVMRSKTTHMKGSAIYDEVNVANRFTYDHAGRLVRNIQKNGNDPELLVSELIYNELGQLILKKLSNMWRQIDYEYNIRGWLKRVNNPANPSGDRFSYELYYNDNVGRGLNNTAKYNGNISAMVWHHYGEGDKKAYRYEYDDLNRLTHATYYSGHTTFTPSNKYKVENVQYDLNGNFKGFKRYDYNGALVDGLRYEYFSHAGNLLQMIHDSQSDTKDPYFKDSDDLVMWEYSYDENGNMNRDVNKKISLVYNYLNLPETVDWMENKKRIEWLYSASGAKLQNIIRDENGEIYKIRDYVNGFEYARSNLAETAELAQFPTSDGRVLANGGAYEYQFYLKDHLGNVRSIFDRNSAVKQKNFYYPFGITITTHQSGEPNPYLYNGKEYFSENGLNWFHYGARFYDPAISRWHTMDPADEHSSPFIYVANNPVYYIDKDGAVKNPFTQLKFQTQDFFAYYLGTHQGQVKAGIHTTEFISDNSAKFASTMVGAALPSRGATLPAAGTGAIISTGAGFLNLGFKVLDAAFYHGTWEDIRTKSTDMAIDVALSFLFVKGFGRYIQNAVRFEPKVASKYLVGANYKSIFGVNKVGFLSNSFGKAVENTGDGLGLGLYLGTNYGVGLTMDSTNKNGKVGLSHNP